MTSCMLRYRFQDGTRVTFPESWLIGFLRGISQDTPYAQAVQDAAKAWREQEQLEANFAQGDGHREDGSPDTRAWR